jgi:hypothetical protein
VNRTLGWPNETASRNTAGRQQQHLRIRDLAENIEAAEFPHRQQMPAVQQPALQQTQVITQNSAMRQSYELSLRNIDDNIYAMAAATAALDRVEGTLLQARSRIERLCADGEPVDLVKVERTLLQLADHINQSVRRADENYINLLRDSRLQLTISETGEREGRSMKVELTLISLDKLMAWKLREGPADPEAWVELIDAMGKVVLQNVQILSSLILTLFAARDYTTGVVQLVTANQNEPPRVGSASAIATDFVQSARAALLRDDTPPPLPQLSHREHREHRQPPSRLMAFLNQMTFQT